MATAQCEFCLRRYLRSAMARHLQVTRNHTFPATKPSFLLLYCSRLTLVKRGTAPCIAALTFKSPSPFLGPGRPYSTLSRQPALLRVVDAKIVIFVRQFFPLPSQAPHGTRSPPKCCEYPYVRKWQELLRIYRDNKIQNGPHISGQGGTRHMTSHSHATRKPHNGCNRAPSCLTDQPPRSEATSCKVPQDD